jgi:L-rhamnonate dehydratase
MWRATINYGRKGLPLQAISAVDLAIWDLLGHIRNEPVYALLGGKARDRLPCYCTSARPDISKELGFVGAKIPCPYGPSAGDEGLRKNVEFFKGWREKVGPDFPLSLDCYMALSVPYAIKLAKALQPYNLKWMEEFLPPDDYAGYAQVKDALKDTGILLTTAEHEYTRYGFRQLIESKCVDILQPDVTWIGGMTEARRVVAMAAAYDIMVIPHGSAAYSYHLQYAFKNCPIAELINLSPKADKIVPYFGGLFTDEPLPKDGWVDLPDRPGFGMTLNREGLVRPYDRSEAASAKQYKANAERPLPEVPHMPF